MKTSTLLKSLAVVSSLLYGLSNQTFAQCGCDNVQFGTSAAPTVVGSPVTLTTCIFGGEFRRVTGLVAGNTYRFETCGDTDFDTQITVYPANCTGPDVAYNDDFCGLQSQVEFIPGTSGDFDVLVDAFFCVSQNTCMTLIATLVSTGGPPPPPTPCLNTSQFPSGCVSAGCGNLVTISTCSFAGEYSCITGINLGGTYEFTSSSPANYITITEGSPAGPVIGFGLSPLNVTTTSSLDLYAHWNLAGCGTDFSCHTTTVQCLSNCPMPPDPCLAGSITNISGCGINQTFTLACNGFWNTSFCGFSVPGQEKIFSFTPTQSGMHQLIVTGGNGWIDYGWKAASLGCGSAGWNCIDDIFSSGTVAFGPLTAGQTYYILGDAEGTASVTHTVSIACPPDPCPQTFTAPYLEDFESFTVINNGTGLMNGWTNVPSGPTSLFRWTPDEGTTPSASTGPNVDHTSGTTSGNYMFTESSSGSTGAVAELISPCINLGALTSPALKFWYHMFGATMGQLHVDISVDQGTTWILDITAPIIGQQQTSGADPWNDVTISLAPWAGQQVKIRFRGIRGTSFTSDMAIDDVEIFNQSAIDLGITDLVNPASSGACGVFSASTPVEITIFNNGAAAHDFTTVPASITANITGPVPSNIVYVHNTGSLASGASVNVIIGNGNFSLAGTYTVNLDITTVGDGNALNNSHSENVTNQTITTFPFIENFESVAAGQTGQFSNGWLSTTTVNPRWESEDATGANENSLNTGPFYDHTFFGSPGGIYIYFETSGGSLGSSSMLVSPCVDFTNNSAPAMSFWYHMFGATMGELHVDVSTDNGATWIMDVMTPIVGQQQTSGGAPYLQETVFLDAFAGQQVLIRFRGIRGTSFEGDIAIDDINLFQQPPCDPFTLAAGTATSDLLQGCPGDDAELTLSGNSTGIGLTIQWEHSTDNIIFTPVPGANTSIFNTGALSGGAHYYRAVVTCAPNSTTSNVITINISDPQVLSSTGATRCGQGNVTLSATTQPGNSLNWYLDAVGGAQVASGNSFDVFVLGDSTFYVAASDGGPPVIFTEDFEGGSLPSGWSATGLWHVTNLCAQGTPANPTHWAYYGIDGSCNFNSGAANSGELTSPVISIPGGLGAQLNFAYLYAGENGTPPTGFDNSALLISQNGGAFTNLSNITPVSSENSWQQAVIDLSAYVGSNIQLRWTFSTGDGVANTETGLQIDQISINVESCESVRVPVAVTVTPAPQVDAGLDRFICNGDATTLTATGGTYNSFLWLPDSLSGPSVSVSPTENTTYILIADDGTCGDVDTIQVDVVSIILNATSDKTTVCGNDSAQFDAVIPTNEGYSYTTIPFNPISGSGTSVSLTDDVVSSALPIGFNFDFFGTNYTQFFISSNGFITFSSAQPNGCCTGQMLPNTTAPNNLVAFAWEDLNPGAGGTIEYFTAGAAPNRMLVMNFNNVPHFGSTTLNVTSQVVLYEGSNNIEIHTTNMPSDGGSHTMGIENASGTEAVVVAGRNSQNWSASNEGVRFMPPSIAAYTFSWSPATGISNTNIADPMVLPPVGVTTVYTVTATHVASGCTTTQNLSLDRFDPQITSTSGDTRCGLGNVTLQATGDGPVDWFDAPAGGTKLHTGNSFSPFVTETTDFYVETTLGGGSPVAAPLPAEITTFAGNVRGYWFTSPTSFTITGLRVPGSTSNQSIAVVRFNLSVPPPTFAGTTNAFDLLYLTQSNSNTGVLPVNISIGAGDVIGVLGQRDGTTTPYGPTGVYSTTIAGFSVDLTRMGMQFALTTTSPQDLWQEPTGNLGLIEITYGSGCTSPRVPVTATVTPAPPVVVTGNMFICGNESTTLTVTTGAGDYTNFDWSPGTFLNTTTGTSVVASPTSDISYVILASGNINNCQNADTVDIAVVDPPSLNLTASGTFFCDAASSQLDAGGSVSGDLSTLFNSNNGQSGNFFNVVAINNVTITSFDGNFDTGTSSDVSIYYRPGGYNGFTNNAAAWTFLGTANGVASLGTNIPTPIPLPVNVTIPAGQTYGFLIISLNNTAMNYTGATGAPAEGAIWAADANLQILAGLGTANPPFTGATFGGGSASRSWNGIIHYGSGSTYNYSWFPSTGLSDPNISNPIATPATTTTYTVLVTDATTGCTSTDSVQIIVEATPTPVISSTIANPVCQGQTAVLSSQYSSSNGYQFSWNSGLVTTETISASIPGVYNLIVSSPNGCTSNLVNYTVEVATIFVDAPITTPVLCNGDSTGTATINALGTLYDPSGNITFGPWAYSANGGPFQASPTFGGLWAATHSFSVYDSASGCTAIVVGIVSQPPPLVASAVVVNNVSCFGGNDGLAVGSATGGTGPYLFVWDTPVPKAGDTLDNVGTGTYNVIVTDANGCVDTATVTITEPPLLTVDLGADDVVLWGSLGFNGCDTINPITAGGTPPYNWAWSSPDDPNLASGASGPFYVACNQLDTIFTYIVVVTDANGCTATDTLELLFSNVNCSTNNNSTKIKICHVPPGNPLNCKTICVQVAAVPAMLAQGSYLGQCLKKCAIPASARTAAPINEVSLEISPNPTSGKIGVMFLSDYDNPTHIVISDIQGRELIKLENDMGGNFFREIDLGQLADGIYMVSVKQNDIVIRNAKVSVTH